MAYSNNIIFADGMMIKPKRQGAPTYLVAKGSINVDRFTETLKKYSKEGWFNFDIKTSKRDPDKMYVEVDTYMLNRQDSGNAPRQPAAPRPQPPPASRTPVPPPPFPPRQAPPPPPSSFEYSEVPPEDVDTSDDVPF